MVACRVTEVSIKSATPELKATKPSESGAVYMVSLPSDASVNASSVVPSPFGAASGCGS